MNDCLHAEPCALCIFLKFDGIAIKGTRKRTTSCGIGVTYTPTVRSRFWLNGNVAGAHGNPILWDNFTGQLAPNFVELRPADARGTPDVVESHATINNANPLTG